MLPQQYCLRWRYHHSNLQTMFSQLLERQAFCDVTLACEGQTLKAHKIVLSACSTYFDTILSQYEEKDPILIMKDVKFVDIKCLVEFMYRGEINVEHCHLATLLKTAEELRIKGLAEVSWREEEPPSEQAVNGVHGLAPQAVMGDQGEPPNKRKRGRPPIDDYDQQFSSPKITNVAGNVQTDENFSNNDVTNSDADASAWEEEHNENMDAMNDHKFQSENEELYQGESMDPSESMDKTPTLKLPATPATPSTPTASQSALEANWPDVIKMNDYLNTGRRQQFWEEPFTKRVMDAIKNKDLEMKSAAELLGVSYGTLYGRYRDAYGCLKHPYRVRDFWTETGPADVLSKLQRKEITLFRAAEQLNVTPQTLSNYLLSLHQGNDLGNDSNDLNEGNSSQLQYDGYEEMPDSDDEKDSILPDVPARPSSSSSALSSSQLTASNILQNHPDITIIKKEKKEEDVKVNNNSDHSPEPVPDDSSA